MAPPTSFRPDPQQDLVLEHQRGALLVTGAAGVGKSATLRERLARLIERGANAERVALVVRSRRDRGETRRALLDRLGRSLPGLHVVTIQGLAHHVMGQRFGAIGFREAPRVLDAADQFTMVQELLRDEREHGRDRWPVYGGLLSLSGFADQVRQLVLRAQESLIDPEHIAERAGDAPPGWAELATFYRRYLDVLAERGSLDFAGLVWQAARAVGTGDRLFDHVLVDDFQDTTIGAEALLQRLGAEDLVLAGDRGSHVFSFQGTTDLPIRRAVDRFNAIEVRLEVPHRGGHVRLEAWRAAHTSEEHAAVARELRRVHVEEGVPWHGLAVLVRRQGPQVASLLRALDDAGIPRTAPEARLSIASAPSTRPYLLALRWIAAPPQARDELIEPVLTSELGGLSPASARSLLRLTRATGRPSRDALQIDEGLTEQERLNLERMRRVLAAAEIRADSVLDAFAVLWKDLPCSTRLVEGAERSHDARVDLDGVLQLSSAVAQAASSSDQSTEAFLRQAELGEGGPTIAGRGAPEHDAVEVLTAHAASGRQFDTVVVVGAVEGDFPSLARPEPMFDLPSLSGALPRSSVNRMRLEDERRLFGVAVSRARRRVLLTASDPHGSESDEAVATRFAQERGIGWRPVPAADASDPVSVAEAAAAWRRMLAAAGGAAPDRLGALAGLLALRDDPGRWWFQHDWSGPSRPPREELRLSYSRLDHLENCELQYLLADELGLDPGGGYQAWVGKLLHQLIEDCENGAIERTPEAFVGAITSRWQPARFPSHAVSEAERLHAIRVIVPNWYQRYGDLAAEATERRFRFDYEGAVVNGVIDRIGPVPEGHRRITDYKTGNADNAPKPQESLQLGIYYLAVNECEDLASYRPVHGVELAYLAGKKRQGELLPLSWPVSERDEERYKTRMRERLSALIGRIGALDQLGRYVPNTGANCFFCRFQTLCSRYPEGGEV
ncbi:MAG TPA: ATP-dependent DNA helicase, partial [Actinomycetota bacterium]|nr:ATP-dependent DNA helicase [Actinomycetota bacterium]